VATEGATGLRLRRLARASPRDSGRGQPPPVGTQTACARAGVHRSPSSTLDRRETAGLAHRRNMRSEPKSASFCESIRTADQPYSIVARNELTSEAAIAPSPTADATRLTEPWRRSPATKTPGWLVSR